MSDRARSWALRAAALVVVALGALTRLGWLPLARHKWDGHERDYLHAFQGQDWSASTRLMPTLAQPYAWLGGLTGGDERALLGLNLAVGIGAVALAIRLGWRRWGPAAGLALGTLLALSPEWAFWSASAYNVGIPAALVLAGLALGPASEERLPAGSWWGLPLVALGCSMRLELALLAPVFAVLGGWRPALGVVGALAGIPLMQTAPELAPLGVVWPANLRLVALLGPLGSGVVLAAVDRRSWPLALGAVWVHAVGAAFDDYGTRHALFGGLCLMAVAASARGWRRVLWLPALGASLAGMATVAHWFYADVPTYVASLPELGPPPECTEVMDDPLREEGHWRARSDWPADACWGEEAIHRAWTSRGLQDRALRMRVLYDPAPIGVLELPGGPRVYYALEAP